MKYIVKTEKVTIPQGVTVDIKSRVVTVKGPRGTVTKAFKHLKLEIVKTKEADKKDPKTMTDCVVINSYMSSYKHSALVATCATHINNMITGVTKGYRYKMHLVKKHFPIEVAINGEVLEIGRFLGGRHLRIVKLLDGVTCKKNDKNPEELWFDGNDIEKVSLTCALVNQSCYCNDKDQRKFLDGIYVNEKTHIA